MTTPAVPVDSPEVLKLARQVASQAQSPAHALHYARAIAQGVPQYLAWRLLKD